jgi:YHS domain-containing protein
MVRLALYAGLVAIIVLLISTWTRGHRSRRGTGPGRPADVMVLDPVCSTYLPKSKALARRTGNETVYFCSQACADRYDVEHGKPRIQ